MDQKKSLHIAFIAPTAYRYYQGKGFGGAELQVVQLAQMFVRAGYRVSVLTNDYGQPEREVYGGVELLKAPLRFLGGSKIHLLRDSVRFIRQLVKLEPDYCFFKNPDIVLFLLALAEKINSRIKVVKILASDMDCNVSGWSPVRLAYRFGVKWTKRFVFQTEKQQAVFRNVLKKDGPVIRNIFYPPPLTEGAVPEKDIDVLWIGSFDQNKYPEGFYDAARSLPQYRFAMIAKQVPPAYAELHKKITALPNITYFGCVPFEKTQGFFDRAKINLCTSVIEGFPNTFLQAWYSKLPVVSLSFPCDGILQKYGIGRVSGTPEQLTRDITELLGDPELRREMGEKAFRYVAGNHLPEQILKCYQAAFDLPQGELPKAEGNSPDGEK